MRIGFNVPQFGPAVTPALIVQAAQKAEALGYDSLWVAERLPTSHETQEQGSAGPNAPVVWASNLIIHGLLADAGSPQRRCARIPVIPAP